jgi:hypothetical protein
VENIKMDPVDIGWGGVEWIDLAQDRAKCRGKGRALVNVVMNLQVP